MSSSVWHFARRVLRSLKSDSHISRRVRTPSRIPSSANATRRGKPFARRSGDSKAAAAASRDLKAMGSPDPKMLHASTPSALFPIVDPAVDGDECTQDCASCSIKYPSWFSIEESDALYGEIQGWATQILVATGKTDWVRNVADERGSVMEALAQQDLERPDGRLMLSASNLPLPDPDRNPYEQPTRCLLLPAWKIIDNVTPASVPGFVSEILDAAPTTESPLPASTQSTSPANRNAPSSTKLSTSIPSSKTSSSSPTATAPPTPNQSTNPQPSSITPSAFKIQDCPHDAVILLCSQQTRDARCGKSAPLLRREFERHLRPLGLQRDLDDDRPGGVGIYFISHVGGHKYSANVLVYRKRGGIWPQAHQALNGTSKQPNGPREPNRHAKPSGSEGSSGATQCIWLARVRPEHCEGIIQQTILKGKIVHPEHQLRGGFDRERGVVSW